VSQSRLAVDSEPNDAVPAAVTRMSTRLSPMSLLDERLDGAVVRDVGPGCQGAAAAAVRISPATSASSARERAASATAAPSAAKGERDGAADARPAP